MAPAFARVTRSAAQRGSPGPGFLCHAWESVTLPSRLSRHGSWRAVAIAAAPPPPPPPPPTPSASTSSWSPSINAPALKLSRRLGELAQQHDEARQTAQQEAAQICTLLARKLKTESSSFRAHDIIQLVAAACKLEQAYPPLLDAVAAQVLRGMVTYPLFGLCNVTNGFARLGHRHRQLMDAVAVFLAEPSRTQELSPVDIASLVFAYAQLAHHPKNGLLEACADRLKDCSLELGGPNCAIILNSYARLNECNPVLFGVLSRSVVQTRPESYQAQHISLIMNSYARCQIRKPQMMHILSGYLSGRISELSPQNVSNIVHAFSRLDCYNHELFHALMGRLVREDLQAYKIFELAVLTHNLAKLKAGGQSLFDALFGELSLRPPEVWEPKAVAQVLDALRRRPAFVHEGLLSLLFHRLFDRLQHYAVHPLTQATWCLIELEALDLASELPHHPEASASEEQGNPAARHAMRRVLERLEELNSQEPFTPTQRGNVQHLIRAYHYRHELDYGLQPQKVKSFCKAQFDISTSLVSAVGRRG